MGDAMGTVPGGTILSRMPAPHAGSKEEGVGFGPAPCSGYSTGTVFDFHDR
jgi:hypothetical protein